jgi:hypothetical protein
MSVAYNPITIEQVLQRYANDQIIAQPGESIEITPRDARRKVNRYLGEEISMMMYGLEPVLVYSQERLVWRIPIEFTSSQRGYIGALDVDARTGDLIIPPNFEEEIKANAWALIKAFPYTSEG